MTKDLLLRKFDALADTPNAVAKLRELVLGLAVQGKLIASTATWTPQKLETLASKIGSGATPAGGRNAYHESGVPLIRSMNVYFEGFRHHGLAYLNDAQAAALSGVTVKSSDVLLNITGASIGRVTTAPEEMDGARVNQHVCIIRPTERLQADFLAVYLASPAIQAWVDNTQVGATRQALTKSMIQALEIPLPPLAEQKRIVAKVDELMALCDELEAQQRERAARHAAFQRAALAAFDEHPAPARLNLLFHPAAPIAPAELRKTILSLAVRGKLVPQEEADRSVEELLVRIGVNEEHLSIPVGEQRYTVPETWCWLRFPALGERRLGKMLDATKNRGEPKLYLRNTNVQWWRIDLQDLKQMRIEETEREEFRLQEGDLLICEGGEPGRCAIWSETSMEMYFQKALHRVRPSAAVMSEYIAMNIEVDCSNGVLPKLFTGATIKHLTGKSLSQYCLPLPPLAEQCRIVSKVDDLMALVDQLEAQLAAERGSAATLLDAVVAELASVG